MSEELGKAHVKITADTTDLNTKVDAAKEKVAEIGPVATTVQQDADKLWDSMTGGAQKATEAAKETGEAVTAVGDKTVQMAVVGAAAILALKSAYEEITKYIETVYADGAEKADKSIMAHQLDSLKARMKVNREELEKLNSELDQTQRDNPNEIYGDPNGVHRYGRSIKTIQDELNARMKESDVLRGAFLKNANNEYEAAEEKKQAKKDADQQKQVQRDGEHQNAMAEAVQKNLADEKAADDEMYANWAKNAQKKADQEEKDRQEDRKHTEFMQRAAERLNETRVRGILEQQEALRRLYEAQSRGFGNNDGSSSIQGGFDMLAREIQAGFSRMGSGA